MGRACSKYCFDDGDGGRELASYGIGSETDSTLGVGTEARYNKAKWMSEQLQRSGELTLSRLPIVFSGQAGGRVLTPFSS